MKRLSVLVGLGAIVLGTQAFAQSKPWISPPDVPSLSREEFPDAEPRSDVEITGSLETAPVSPYSPLSPSDVRVMLDRPGCEVQSYTVSPARHVRVHRC